MKRVTATQARRNWFRLLDEVVDGEVVVVERNGRRVVIRHEDDAEVDEVPSYEGLIAAEDADAADRWGWDWDDDGELVPSPRDDAP